MIKRRFTTAQRTGYVLAWKKSNLSRSAFARQEGLNEKTLSRWVREASGASAGLSAKKPLKLLPVLMSTPKSSSLVPAESLEIILPNGICLRTGTINGAIVRLIQELGQCD